MKSMKKAKPSMSSSAAYSSVAEKLELKPGQVKDVVNSIMELAASELKKSGSFKLGGCLNMKLKVRPATKARKGVNPFTGEPCTFKAKKASKTVRALPMKALKEMVNLCGRGAIYPFRLPRLGGL